MLFIPPNALGLGLNKSQKNLLAYAGHVGDSIGWPETIQSILLTESSAGLYRRPIGGGSSAIGVMMVQPRTAHYVTQLYDWYPKHNDMEQYRRHLATDDLYSIWIGALYFKRCKETFKRWARAVVCYYEGVYGASRLSHKEILRHPYYNKVVRNLHKLRKLYRG